MLTFIVEQDQVDKDYTLKELKDFSKRIVCRVIVRGFCIMEKGALTWLA